MLNKSKIINLDYEIHASDGEYDIYAVYVAKDTPLRAIPEKKQQDIMDKAEIICCTEDYEDTLEMIEELQQTLSKLEKWTHKKIQEEVKKG